MLRLNLRDKDPISARDACFPLKSAFAKVLDVFGPALHDLDNQRHFASESLQHEPVRIPCDFTVSVFP